MNLNKILEKSRITALSLLHITDKEVRVDEHWDGKLEKYNRYDVDVALDKVLYEIGKKRKRRNNIRLTVATISVAATVAILFITLNAPEIRIEPTTQIDIVLPEHRIMAELSDEAGAVNKIDASTKEVVVGSTILKNDPKHSSISYTELTPSQATLNQLKVPRKGIYKLILQDSTVVILNSDSYLEYPTAFDGKTREVRLVGEALFQVKKNNNSRFIVHTSRGDITVHGTTFNIKSYDNEPMTNVTLVSGSVTVNNDHCVTKMIPNERAVILDSVITKSTIDIRSEVAWLNNYFDYTDAPLGLVINDLMRCYDVDINLLTTKLNELRVTFYLSKDNSIETVMEVLEKSGVMKVTKTENSYTLQ